MSNLLKISRDGNFYLEDKLITTEGVEDINAYLIQILAFNITIEEGVTLDKLIHSVFELKDFILSYFSEEYEAVRAFAYSSRLDKKYKSIKFYKSFKVEFDDLESDDEYLHVLPEVQFIESSVEETGFNKLGDLPIYIDENIKLIHDDINLKLKSKFTFLDVLTCVFDEISYMVKSGEIPTAQH